MLAHPALNFIEFLFLSFSETSEVNALIEGGPGTNSFKIMLPHTQILPTMPTVKVIMRADRRRGAAVTERGRGGRGQR